MSNTCKILIVDDEEQLLSSMSELLGRHYGVSTTETLDGAKELLRQDHYDVVLLDIRLKDGISGLDLLPITQELNPSPAVVLMSAYIDKPIAIKATNNGATGILEKPFEPDDIEEQLSRVIKRKLNKSNEPSSNSIGHEPNGLSLDSYNFCLKTTTGESLSLTKTEYQILSLLMNRPNQWIQRENIESQIWPGIQVSRNTLDTHFSNLKKRIPELRSYFESRRGFGIRFNQQGHDHHKS
jgi:two-component system alkaline phosphatase synthesis response regulator PhoP